MGTTLTGLTPATTYDALIKVGDNGPLSATAKYVGDGLGNDSVVALSTSSVGIGTTSPTQLLHVAGNVRITGALYDGNNAAGTSGQILSSTGTGTDWIDVSSLGVVDGSGTANYVSKWSDPNTLTNSVIYDNGTNVGIGTATPNTKLTVFQSGASGIATMDISGGGTGAGALQISAGRVLGTTSFDLIQNNAGAFINQRDNNPLGILVNGSERLSITSAGNVGIGTSSPTTKLDVRGSSGTIIQAKDSGAFCGVVIDAAAASTPFTRLSVNAVGKFEMGYYNNLYYLNNNTGVNDAGAAMVVTSAGNVGIGTSSPAYKLQVNGNAYCTDLSLPAAGGIFFDSGASKYLDDYEEGTWTPSVVTAGGTGTASYVSRSGTYTKIGRQVVVQFIIDFAKSTLSGGTLQIEGFPFQAQVGIFPQAPILIDSLATALTNPLIQMGGGTTKADLIQNNGSTTAHAGLSVDTYLGAGTMPLRGTITYFV